MRSRGWLTRTLGTVGLAVAVAAVLSGFPGRGQASETDEATVESILGILLDRGLIDEKTHYELARKHAREQQKTASVDAGPLDGFEWSGNLRLRYEGFYYDNDSLGVDRDNRYRFRYRARLGFTKAVNDWLNVELRLASGTDDHRSTNRTLGDDEDFDPDELFIDRAFARAALPGWGGTSAKLVAGKISNPFMWEAGRDLIVWDSDITPEGAALVLSRPLDEAVQLFANVGGFIVDENSSSKDPKVFAGQVGARSQFSNGVSAGIRASLYEWRSLDESLADPNSDEFIDRALGTGNLLNAFDSRARIGETSGYLGLSLAEDWPVLLYGSLVTNFTADDAILGGIPVDEENLAWGAGIELGSSKRLVKLGAGYFYVEANSVISQFTDSDLFDGFTNRRGWIFYASRRLADGVDLTVTFLDSDSIKNSGGALGPFAVSSSDADRKRLQTDLIFAF